MRNRTVHLVTGGAGFIGSHLVERLVQDGAKVRVLDDLSTGREANLAPFGDAVELLRGDVRDRNAVASAARGVRSVFHLAALVSVERSVRDPALAEDVNAIGTIRVLEAAREAGARRVVFASSAAVYGDSEVVPKREEMPADPVSPYAVSKEAAERYVRFFATHLGLPGVSLRFFNVFGPRQDPESPYAAAIPRFVSALLARHPPTVFGDGRQSRDFCPVEDVVEACVLAASSERAGAGEAINVGRGTRLDLLSLLAMLGDITGARVEPLFAPPRPGDVRHSQADLAAARAKLGFVPSASLREALERTVRWYSEGGS
ncbi:MAG: NAD-dependent epimerase/dehydratase family protein [Myxococcota bacterium]|nr:NAD-dependent epimerase/dehydratase family protein [Myxococcota bacterium]